MVIVRIEKGFSIGRDGIYKVIVDGKNALTLHPDSESKLDLPIGHHTVYFKKAELAGIKSNKLKIEIKSLDDNITIEAKTEMGTIVASVIFGQLESIVVLCSCGASNKAFVGIDKNCEFCGKPLVVPSAPTETGESQLQPPIQQPQVNPQFAQPQFQQGVAPPSEKPEKPWYKKTWVWVLIFLAEAIIFGGIGGFRIAILVFIATIIGFFSYKKFFLDKRK